MRGSDSNGYIDYERTPIKEVPDIKEKEIRFSNLKSAYEAMKYQYHPDYIYNVEYNKNDGGYFVVVVKDELNKRIGYLEDY